MSKQFIKQFINNYKAPNCQTCKYYKQFFIYSNKNAEKYSQCMKYGKQNVGTEQIHFEFAKDVRRNTEKCGPDGSQHEEKKWKII